MVNTTKILKKKKEILLTISQDMTLRYWMFNKKNKPVYVVDVGVPKLLSVDKSTNWKYISIVAQDRWLVSSKNLIF